MNTTLSRLQALEFIRNGTAGSKFGAELIAVDKFGNNIGPEDIGASLNVGFGSSVTFGDSIVDYLTSLEASGRLTFSFIGTLSGIYSISVFVAVNRTSVLDYVSDAPMAFIVSHSEVSFANTVLISPFLTLTTAGVLSSFQIFAKDAYENPVVNVAPALLTARLFAPPSSASSIAIGQCNRCYIYSWAFEYHICVQHCRKFANGDTIQQSSPSIFSIYGLCVA